MACTQAPFTGWGSAALLEEFLREEDSDICLTVRHSFTHSLIHHSLIAECPCYAGHMGHGER